MRGVDLFNLSLFRAGKPKAYIDEARAFVNSRNPSNTPYSRSQIYRAEERLGLTRKVGSTTSELAFTPINLQKRRNYWTAPYPLGIEGESTSDVIDLDEARFTLTSTNRKRGKQVTYHRCDAEGKYRKGERGTNLLCAVSGDDQVPFSMHRQYSEGGTDLWRFYQFLNELIDYLATHFYGRSFLITMDNLNIHKHPIILNLIHTKGHRVVFRAPYWSCDGPIEYVFNKIQTDLQGPFGDIDTVGDLENRIDVIIGGIQSYREYFLSVGFKDN